KKLAPPTPRAPKASITYHDKGLSTLHVTGRTSDVLAAYHAARLDPAAWLTGDATTRVAAPAITTVLNMDIGNFAAWRTHPNNAAEIQVQLTNGEWLDGAELVNRKLDKAGYIALISPTDGPVNLYATTLAGDDPANPRRATRELRLLMSADGPTCAWADCHQPADVSEAHHLTEWASGGGTEIGNLCWLCTYHNRQNGRPGRGRMHRHRGRVTWQSPSGYRIPGGVDHADPDRREQRLAHTPATT
ncbi:HNH endonuclease, partial [Corynebacterium sp. NML180780]|uniref:HNH endonuclease n=1 Tax=Corynebacterium sp. NML180780 TaxID=2598459 RepID=UPI0016484C12